MYCLPSAAKLMTLPMMESANVTDVVMFLCAPTGRYITDPHDCRFAPKPADIIRHIERASADDGRPGADEAWGILLRVIRDERETGVLTEEMRIGWTTCQPILDQGDKVGARMAFRETYSRQVENARKMAVAPRWTVTIGTDPTLRQSRLREALEAIRIGVWRRNVRPPSRIEGQRPCA